MVLWQINLNLNKFAPNQFLVDLPIRFPKRFKLVFYAHQALQIDVKIMQYFNPLFTHHFPHYETSHFQLCRDEEFFFI